MGPHLGSFFPQNIPSRTRSGETQQKFRTFSRCTKQFTCSPRRPKQPSMATTTTEQLATISQDTPEEEVPDFDFLAKRLFFVNGGSGLHGCTSEVWRHETTGASVYIGNIYAAREREILEPRGITAVVNCQDLNTSNFFEGRPTFSYLRFPVARWEGTIFPRESRANVCSQAEICSRVL